MRSCTSSRPPRVHARDPRPWLLRRLVLRPDPLLLADAYFRGVIDVEEIQAAHWH